MKIFNWVHRRFMHKDGLTQNYEKKNVVAGINIGDVGIEKDDDEQFLVVRNAFDDVLDGWNGGILTIGTFGYHPLLKDENYDSWPTLQEESENTHKNEKNEEANPLVYNINAHAYHEEGLLEMKMDENRVSLKHDDYCEFEFDHVIKKINDAKKERTTLADLFIADSSEEPTNKEKQLVKEKIMNNNNNNNNNKTSFSFPKKLIGGDQGRPMHKLNRLMRRMLKRKIHPDLGLNKYNSSDSKVWEIKREINESASLLPIQDVGI